jgi:hypothetical protein
MAKTQDDEPECGAETRGSVPWAHEGTGIPFRVHLRARLLLPFGKDECLNMYEHFS